MIIAEYGSYVVTQDGAGENDFTVRKYFVDGREVETGLTLERAKQVARNEDEGDKYEAACMDANEWMFSQED